MFLYPHYYTPVPEAQAEARKLMAHVRSYMDTHPLSELHTRGKMFGVLLTDPITQTPPTINHQPLTLNHQPPTLNHESSVLWAFSGVLDGSYHHEGFVEPIYEIHPSEIIGTDREDSQRKQRWLFSQYHLLNANGETRTIADLWSDNPDAYNYSRSSESSLAPGLGEKGFLPPSGTGECCAPKLLQAAYRMGLRPIAMAEFWMGASPRDEIRVEGQFYPACIAKCRPLLRYMLQGISVQENPLITRGRALADQTRILYEDDDLIAVSKPSGLLTVPGKDEQYSLEEHLSRQHPTFLKAVHRLDMDTSGIVLLAKNDVTYTELQRQFAAHETTKVYRARLTPSCTCALSEQSGVIDLPLFPNPLDRPRQIVDWQHGKHAVTRWTKLHDNLIELYPETGRTHQLRVHCAHPDGLGTPILGDRLYGVAGDGERLMLHACSLSFTHPRTHERMTIDDLPQLFQ